ncbi:MAG TPA: Dabb family protein [Anaerolineales bacterium]|nr:Dabb family protein [Anaerolineales bacterium]HRF50235.1 Dabb family protein [Anaerolineales bacterium]
MFIHTVYFWLRQDLTPDQHAQFHAGVHSLTMIESVHAGYVGRPAPTERAIIERGYSTGLIVIFADQLAHDRYQVDPVHDRFRETCATFWDKIVIYDTISEAV